MTQLIRPRGILALGRFAAQTLLGTSTTLGKLRGQVHEYLGIPVVVTYHPAAVLRNAEWKRLVAIYMPWIRDDEELEFFSEGRFWQKQTHIY